MTAKAEIPGLPVKGYQPQTPDKVRMVNANKELEEHLLRLVESVQCGDPRWLAIARTHFEQGFMALNRAIFRPARIGLPGDQQ